MRIALNYLKIKEDYNRLEVLHWGHFAFVFLALSLELFDGLGFLEWAVTCVLISIFYRLFSITKRELFYSFWSFSLILILFFLDKIILEGYEGLEIKLLYSIGFILLLVEIYILSSPIYYPRVSWWEYDFRYRTDLKVTIRKDEKESEARVTDLRRNAGCIASFEEFKVGEDFVIESNKYFEGLLKVEIVSKRIYSLGRPYSYGVKFSLDSEEKKNSYLDLLNIWKNETLQRKQRKFRKKQE